MAYFSQIFLPLGHDIKPFFIPGFVHKAKFLQFFVQFNSPYLGQAWEFQGFFVTFGISGGVLLFKPSTSLDSARLSKSSSLISLLPGLLPLFSELPLRTLNTVLLEATQIKLTVYAKFLEERTFSLNLSLSIAATTHYSTRRMISSALLFYLYFGNISILKTINFLYKWLYTIVSQAILTWCYEAIFISFLTKYKEIVILVNIQSIHYHKLHGIIHNIIDLYANDVNYDSEQTIRRISEDSLGCCG